MIESTSSQEEVLRDFFNFIYDDLNGYAYLAFKSVNNNPNFSQKSWKQEFYKWPEECEKLVSRVKQQTEKYEVYCGVSIYRERKATKEFIVGAKCWWVEFDGNIPTNFNGIPKPSIRIQSSSYDHQHWYWKSNSSITEILSLEKLNRSLAGFLSADISGWDSTQVLRPPGTVNHKRSCTTILVENTSVSYNLEDFSELPDPLLAVEVQIPEAIPPIEDVIAKYKFPAEVWHLFKKGMQEGKRSDGLMALGYYLTELQLQDDEVFALLLNADERWGKFSGRSDQVLRLSQIVAIARAKYPYVGEKDVSESARIPRYGLQSLLNSSIQLEWVWQGLLQEAGYFLLTGPSGIGKTQLSLNFAAQAVLGGSFLERKIIAPRRMGYLSLEMGAADLKHFLSNQAGAYTDPNDLSRLEEDFRLFPVGESMNLASSYDQELVEEIIFEERLNGLIIDSMMAATDKDLSNEVDGKALVNWISKVCNRHKCFIWFIHHHRKATSDNKKPNKLSDVYGWSGLVNRATTVLCLWNSADENAIWGIPLKVRLSQKPENFLIFRDGRLNFTLKSAGISVIPKKEKALEVEVKQEKSNEIFTTGKGSLEL